MSKWGQIREGKREGSGMGCPSCFGEPRVENEAFLELVAESGGGCSGLRAGRQGEWGWRGYSGRSKSGDCEMTTMTLQKDKQGP